MVALSTMNITQLQKMIQDIKSKEPVDMDFVKKIEN